MHTLTDGAMLLRAVLDHPEDDVPRLILADWLDKDAQAERAAGIRFMCAHPSEEATFHCDGWPDHPPWVFLSGSLWSHGRADLTDLARTVPRLHTHGSRSPTLVIRRGFVEAVRCTLAAWREHGPAVARAHPVTRVELTDRRPLRENYATDRPPRFAWRPDDGGWGTGDPDEDGAVLPEAIFRLIRRHPTFEAGRTLSKGYPAAQDATDALSDALVAWAKLPEARR